MLDHVDSWGCVVQISLRANSDDWVVVNEVQIGDHAGPSIGFIIVGCLIAV
jgi:hypothetical protein